jgi:hypothetical protein
LCIFWRALEWKVVMYFMLNWFNVRPFGIVVVICFIMRHMVYFSVLVCFNKKNLATLIRSIASIFHLLQRAMQKAI